MELAQRSIIKMDGNIDDSTRSSSLELDCVVEPSASSSSAEGSDAEEDGGITPTRADL